MTLEKRLHLARRAAGILASVWRGRVERADAQQEAVVVALEKRDGWWDEHTESYILQTLKANLWGRLIRKRWYWRPGGKLTRIIEYPLAFEDSGRERHVRAHTDLAPRAADGEAGQSAGQEE